MTGVDLCIDSHNALGEAALWSRAEHALYWIDVLRPGRVFRSTGPRAQVDFWEFEDLVTGLNFVAGGGLLVHGRTRIRTFYPESGRLRPLFSLPPSTTSMRFNDGRCDRSGRLWVGTMPNNITDEGSAVETEARNGQICMIGDGSVSMLDAQLGCPNALCWSPDERCFYIADSCDGWLYAYDFDAQAGMISDRKPFCHLDGLGVPDGAAVDEDGYIWNARWGAGAVVRISPHGRLDRVIDLPVTQPTSCCFGGEDLRTLYITSARWGLSAERLRSEPLAGGIFSLHLDVPGMEVPLFAATPVISGRQKT